MHSLSHDGRVAQKAVLKKHLRRPVVCPHIVLLPAYQKQSWAWQTELEVLTHNWAWNSVSIKCEKHIPCHDRSRGELGFSPSSTSVRKCKWWCWGRALVECWAGNHVIGSRLAQQACLQGSRSGVSVPAARWCWYAHLHQRAAELVRGSAGRCKGRKIKEVNNNEQKACWFPISRVETRGIVILVDCPDRKCSAATVLNPVLAGAFS